MQVRETTLKQLVQGEKQFRVPLFQRPYTWGNSNHTQLWTDILDQYARSAAGESGEAPLAHFMGSLVLAPITAPFSQNVASALIVDGQQRLTTLMLALCAIRDARAIAEPDRAAWYNENYLINRWETGPLHYRLLPTQADRPAFFACVDGSPARGGSGGIGGAYSFFASQLAGRRDLDLERLTTTIAQGLTFVDITTGAEDNPHRIFESLNATGIALTQADLLRNYLFMLLPTRADAVYEQIWRPMELTLGAEHLEGLARVDLQRRGIDAAVDDVYRLHQRRLNPLANDEARIEQEIRDLAVRATHYKRLVDPSTEEDPVIRDRLAWLRRWKTQTTYPLLMYLFDMREREQCTVPELRQALAYIESFLVRRHLTGVSPNALNRLMLQMIGQLNQEKPVPEAVREALSYERFYWATDDELRAAIRTRNFYFYGRWEQKSLILRRLEESYQDAEMVDLDRANLTIEHIMPQTLSDGWREQFAKLGQDADVVRAELVHTLGNLTLTAYNGTLSNNPFERKKQIFEASHLRLNGALTEQEWWGRDEILARADELAEAACRIWPGPIPGARGAKIGFDWGQIDAAIAAIPPGRWTTFGDLAEFGGVSGSAAREHVASATGLIGTHRVLEEGHLTPGLRSSALDERSLLREVLRAEGLTFDAAGAPDPARRLTAEDLAGLLGERNELGTTPAGRGKSTRRTYEQAMANASLVLRAAADRLFEWAEDQGFETPVRANARALVPSPGARAILWLFPNYGADGAVCFDLELLELGYAAGAETLLTEIRTLNGGTVTGKVTYVYAAIFVRHWERFRQEILPRYVQACRAGLAKLEMLPGAPGPMAGKRRGPRSVEDLCHDADLDGIGAPLRKLVETTKRFGWNAYSYWGTVNLTPRETPALGCLVAASPRPRANAPGSIHVWVMPGRFPEFYPSVTGEEVAGELGVKPEADLTAAEMETFIHRLEQLLQRVRAVDSGPADAKYAVTAD